MFFLCLGFASGWLGFSLLQSYLSWRWAARRHGRADRQTDRRTDGQTDGTGVWAFPGNGGLVQAIYPSVYLLILFQMDVFIFPD